MHCILTSKSITLTYVSASTSHLQVVKVLRMLDIHYFKFKHLVHEHKAKFYFMFMYEVFKIEIMDVKRM
jgi:hypothetical protein